jgi:uncharacterized membrane protein
MLSKVRIAGHPIHPMLVAFPIALYTATVVTLLAFVGTGDVFWVRAALWANVAGVVMAGLAALPGFIDLISLPRHSRAQNTGIRHAAFNVLSLTLFVISAVVLYRHAGGFSATNAGAHISVTAPLALSIIGIVSTLAAGWLGWTLVQTYHVGIQRAGELEGRPERIEERGERPMPPSYQETYRTTIRH